MNSSSVIAAERGGNIPRLEHAVTTNPQDTREKRRPRKAQGQIGLWVVEKAIEEKVVSDPSSGYTPAGIPEEQTGQAIVVHDAGWRNH